MVALFKNAGHAPKGNETSRIVDEYRLSTSSSRLDERVLCKIYSKPRLPVPGGGGSGEADLAAVVKVGTMRKAETFEETFEGGAGTAGEEEKTAGSRSMWYAPAVKEVTTTAAALLTGVGVGFLGPAAAAFVEEELPRVRAVAALMPPYLQFLVINVIIISIAASSRFQLAQRRRTSLRLFVRPPPQTPMPADAIGGVAGEEMMRDVIQPEVALQVPVDVPLVAVKAAEVAAVQEPVVEIHTVAVAPEDVVDENFSISRSTSTWTQRRRGAQLKVAADGETEVLPFSGLNLTNSREKPLVSARFSGRKAAKPSPKGSRALRLARPRKEEMLESTWKAITEGRGPPLARHLKMSNTWDPRPGHGPADGGSSGEVNPAAVAPAGVMRKAETFNDGGGAEGSKPAPPPVRQELSLRTDELNLRVEAFIHRFNMEMQESLKQCNDMLGRGSRY